MIDDTLFERLTSRIMLYRDAMIDMQLKLTAVPALSPENGGDGEYEKSLLLQSLLSNLGFPTIRNIDAPDNRVSSGMRPNLIITVPGENRHRMVWILTHMDIVPPGARKLWSSDPYHGYVKDGYVYGRGTEDNQQDMIASIFAAKSFLDEGIAPQSSVGLAFVSDEETASDFGLKYVLESANNPFSIYDLIIVPDSGNKQGTIIEISEKSILWLEIRTTGKQCHGSRPSQGKNAFLAASHLIVKLEELHFTFGISDPLFDPPNSTFQPTKKEANVPNINTIPGEDVFYMDCRVLPQYPLENVVSEILEIAKEIERHFSVAITVTAVHKVQAPSPTEHNAPVVLALQEAIKDVYHKSAHPIGIGAGTVAAFFRSKGYPAAVWCRTTQTAHQPNERCQIDNMLGNAKVFTHIFLQH